MAKLLLLLSLSVLYLISINQGLSASAVPDHRDFELEALNDRDSSGSAVSDQRKFDFEPLDRRINEMRVYNEEEQQSEDDEEDDIMDDAKEINRHLKVVHKKPDYEIFDMKVAESLIAEADKAVAKIKVIIESDKGRPASSDSKKNVDGSQAESTKRRRRPRCPSFMILKQTFTRLMTNYTAARAVVLQAKKAKNEALIRYKVYHNLQQQFCTSSNSSICNSISASVTAENNKYTQATGIIKAATKKLLEFGLKLLNLGERVAKCFGL